MNTIKQYTRIKYKLCLKAMVKKIDYLSLSCICYATLCKLSNLKVFEFCEILVAAIQQYVLKEKKDIFECHIKCLVST